MSDEIAVTLQPETTRSPAFISVYSNHSRMAMSPWDITVTFAVTQDLAIGKVTLEDQVALRLSPQHFKALCVSFAKTLKAWESRFGEVKIPPETGQIADAMAAVILGKGKGPTTRKKRH